jgi:hypothetical protein
MPKKTPAEITAQLSSPPAVKSVENQRNSPPTCWLKGLCESSSRGDKSAIELFVVGVRGWGSWRWRQLENSQST